MKKIALVFVLAVFVPSLALAWLAGRSLRDQRLILERQQYLLYQGVADALAKNAEDFLSLQQHEFGRHVEHLMANRQPSDVTASFDSELRAEWPLAEVGFVVTVAGNLLCPSPQGSPVAKAFYTENGKFLCNLQPAEVYWNSSDPTGNSAQKLVSPNVAANPPSINSKTAPGALNSYNGATKSGQQSARNVYIQPPDALAATQNNSQQYSKAVSSEAEFRELVGNSTEGSVSRFLENKLNVLFWYRSPRNPSLIFGVKLSLPQLKQELAPVAKNLDPAVTNDITVALLDDTTKPAALSCEGFTTDWKHPFVATEISEVLPHWEVALYLLNPAKLVASARTLKLTLGLLIVVLLLAIGIGGWLIFSDLNRHLALARQKTDFVSNVSHELKTPLTSIRMFSELLSEGRVADEEKRRSYLNIITAETARLTRLINNVLDFSGMERGEKKYDLARCDLTALVREVVGTCCPRLESSGFEILCRLPESPIWLRGDRDALAQVVVNLLSNAEKYSTDRKEIEIRVEAVREPVPHAEVRICDRGSGVPKNCGEKIFEQFYRAHDSLSSGIQGSGLGLTLARQIARAHGGDVGYSPRDGGGSCFTLRVPISPESQA